MPMPRTSGSTFAERWRVLFLLVLAIVLCSLAGWLVFHVGIEVVQLLIAVVAMTITWHLLNRRPNITIDDEFRNW
jgi:4-hydroxybenzoate polyprenyltransferase